MERGGASRHLEALGDFARILAGSRRLEEIARQVVDLVARHLSADRCNFYLADPGGTRLRLIASSMQVFLPAHIELGLGEGLTGIVAQTMEALNLSDGRTNPFYRHFPQLGEEGLASYLGVPMVFHGRANGVLVVRSRQERKAPPEDEMLLLAIASQLAGVVENVRLLDLLETRTPEVAAGIRRLDEERKTTALPVGIMAVLRGYAAAPGLARGPARQFRTQLRKLDIADTPAGSPSEEERTFEEALAIAFEDLRRTESEALDLVGQELSYIFGAQSLLLNDPVFLGEIRTRIRGGQGAAMAVFDTVERFVETMRQARSDYLKERAEDFDEVGRILISKIVGKTQTHSVDYEGAVVLAGTLSPGELMLLASRRVAAVVVAQGGVTSHVSLLSRALGLPAVTGAGSGAQLVTEGSEILVDAAVGNVFVNPSAAVLAEYERIAGAEESSVVLLENRELLGPCRLASGETIEIMANVGLLRELAQAQRAGADGIGLYRTEFPYLVRRDAPNESQQLEFYSQAFDAFPHGITFRTLDLGGDKAAPFLQAAGENLELEENPFLGQRSIRLSLAHPEIFRTQLRALLRASYGRRGRVLFPMICSVDEMKEVLRQFDVARAELRARGMPFDEKIPLGAMIETPAAVEIVHFLCQIVDFLSIGTNDLLQYTVAADRGNRKVASIASNYHPALFNMISRVAWEARKAGMQVSVCGEMGADPACVLFLAGTQVDILSMDSRYVPSTKVLLRKYTMQELRGIADRCLRMPTANEINRFLHAELRLGEDAIHSLQE